MAPKRHLEDPPPAASSFDEESDDDTVDEEENGPVEGEDDKEKSGDGEEEEEEVEDEEDEEDDDDDDEDDNEEEKEKSSSTKTVVTSSSAVSNPQSHSASEDESESGSDTESDNNNNQSPSASDFTIKPIVSKPMNDSVKPEKKNAPAKPNSSTPANPGSKRPAESELNLKDPKKKKVMNSGDDEDARKGRLWSEDDEIAILKGMIDYQSKKGSDPYANMGAFHEYMKKNLRVDVSKNQLMDKIRRLRKKYQTNAEKGENGEDPVFSKAHESKSFELSKKIWGVEANGMDDNAKSSKRKPKQSNKVSNATVLALPVSGVAGKKEEVNVTGKKEEVNVTNGGVKADPDEFWSKYPCLSGSLRLGNCSPRSEDLVRLMIQRMPLIGSSKAKELDDRWRKLQLAEMELSVKKLDLMHEQSRLVLDAMKSPKD